MYGAYMRKTPSFFTPFTYSRIEEIFLEQEEELCWLASLRMLLRFFGLDLQSTEPLEELLKRYDRGLDRVSMAHLSVFLQESGFKVFFHGVSPMVDRVTEGEEAVEMLSRYEPRDDFYLNYIEPLLDLHSLGGKIVLHPSRFSIWDVEGKAILVEVLSREFYGIDDDWKHVVTVIRVGDGYRVFDPYRNLGLRDYGEEWEQVLERWDEITGKLSENTLHMAIGAYR